MRLEGIVLQEEKEVSSLSGVQPCAGAREGRAGGGRCVYF